MKKYIKPIIVSLAFVVILNIFQFAKLTINQAPYFDKAPDKVESVYGMYASENYSDVLYWNSYGLITQRETVKNVENILKTVSATKLDRSDTYLRMFRLNRDDFALSTRTRDVDGKKDAMNTLIASSIHIYSEDNIAYIVCEEFSGYDLLPLYRNIAIYETTDMRLINALSTHKEKDGYYVGIPEWRQHISSYPACMDYIIPIIAEFLGTLLFSICLFNRSKERR